MAGKWVTIGKGNESRPILVGDEKKRVMTPGLFDAPEGQTLPGSYQQVIEAIGSLYNRIDDEMQDQLAVKEYFETLMPTFDDPDAYDQLQSFIRHLFHRLVALEAHLRNLNRTAMKDGVDLRYLYNTLSSIGRQSQELSQIYMELPQYDSREGRDATHMQDQVTASVNKSAETIMALMQQDYSAPPKGKDRTRTDWDHMKRGSLKRYINKSGTKNNKNISSKSDA
jgi:hypothetical protein